MSKQSSESEKFPEDDELSSYARRFAVKYKAPDELRQVVSRLTEETSRERRWKRRNFWRAATIGALAAILAIVFGSWAKDWLTDSTDPYDILTSELRSNYNRLILKGQFEEPNKLKGTSLEDVSAWAKQRLHLQTTGPLPGGDKFHLEKGMWTETSGEQEAFLVYKVGNISFLLIALEAEKDPEWPNALDEGWAIMPPDSPPVFLWYKDKYVYGLTGNTSPKQLSVISKAISLRK